MLFFKIELIVFSTHEIKLHLEKTHQKVKTRLIFGVYSVQITVVDGSQIVFFYETHHNSSILSPLHSPFWSVGSVGSLFLSCESVGWLVEQLTSWSTRLV